MLDQILKEKEYLPVLQMQDGSPVTRENWPQRRQEILQLLMQYSYGRTPEAPDYLECRVESVCPDEFAGKVRQEQVKIGFRCARGFFTFPVTFYNPKKVQRPPVLLHVAFRPAPDRYIPVEEITDAGFALIVLCYKDVVNDNLGGDYSDGIAKFFGTTAADRAPDEWGKIGMWAYAASRVMDYIVQERADLDAAHVAVIGHSRLGKTALWAAAQDERFFAAISNNSGYGGAASSKDGHGERIRDFLHWGSWDWFCENFKTFTDEKEDQKPYDQSFLLALIAPRYLLVGSAAEDYGADPQSEFLTTLHASAAWTLLEQTGLVTPDDLPKENAVLHEGFIGYHLRPGKHFLSREDWNYYIQFLKSKLSQQ